MSLFKVHNTFEFVRAVENCRPIFKFDQHFFEKKTVFADQSRTQKKRKILWDKNPHCYHCNILTILPEQLKPNTYPPNMATIDHIFTRLDPRRRQPHKGEERYWLSCKKCNEERGATLESELPIEELRKRSTGGKRKEIEPNSIIITHKIWFKALINPILNLFGRSIVSIWDKKKKIIKYEFRQC